MENGKWEMGKGGERMSWGSLSLCSLVHKAMRVIALTDHKAFQAAAIA